MGCSESAHAVDSPKKVEKPEPINLPLPTIKKREEKANYLLGNIGEEQYLFAKVSVTNRSIDKLSIPLDYKPYNFSSMLELDSKEFLITGGINFALTDITADVFLYSPVQHTAKKMASMNQPRYTHASTVYNQAVWVIGGRYFGQDEEAILRSCERFSLQGKEWEVMPSLNVKRCTCYAIQWRKDLYVFAGYTGTYERSQKIERLDQKCSKWQLLDFCLNRGIQSAFVLPSGPNQVTIFGGNTNSGPTSSVCTLDFQQRSIISHKNLKDKKTLHKTFAFEDEVFIFGGSQQLLLEIYNITTHSSETVDLKMKQQFSAEVFQVLTVSQSPLKMQYSEVVDNPQIDEKDEIILIFGTTEQPFILEINVSIPSSRMHSVPLSLKLYANSGGVHLHQHSFLLFGGIEDDSLSLVSSQTYQYDHLTREVKKLANMATPRYSFSYLKVKERVYALGGGNSDIDGNLDILDDCEFYDIGAGIWKSMCNIPFPLISSMSLCYKEHLYVFGGVATNKTRNKAILKYNHTEDSWTQLNFHLPFGIEAAFIYPYKPAEFYIFGGRLDNGDSDCIWNLIFAQGSASECSLIQKGTTVEKKSGLKVFKPASQSFLVTFGGKKQIVNYYDVQSLKVMEWDGLRHLKQVFLDQVSNLNSSTMESYLSIAPTP